MLLFIFSFMFLFMFLFLYFLLCCFYSLTTLHNAFNVLTTFLSLIIVTLYHTLQRLYILFFKLCDRILIFLRSHRTPHHPFRRLLQETMFYLHRSSLTMKYNRCHSFLFQLEAYRKVLQ